MTQSETAQKDSHFRLKSHMNHQVNEMIGQSLHLSALYSVILMAALFYATPLFRKSPNVVLLFSVVLCFTLFTQILFLSPVVSNIKTPAKVKNLILWFTASAVSLLWGCFTSWVIYEHLISWSTFFVTLMCCSIAVNYLAIFNPKLKLLATGTSLNLLPPVIVCVAFLPGQQGYSFAIFFSAFGLLLLRIATKQNWSFWENMRTSNKVKAMVDALPGSLLWLDKDKNILGFNKECKKVFSIESERPVPDELSSVVEKVFNGETPLKEVRHGRKTSLISGSLYNHGSEAVIMGLDISSQEVFETELEQERQQLLNNIKHFEMGEVFEHFNKELKANKEGVNVSEFHQIFTEEVLSVGPVISWALNLSVHGSEKDVLVERHIDDSLLEFVTFKPINLFLGLFHVIKNSVEAVSQLEHPKICVNLKTVGRQVQITIEDNGPGIEDGFEDVIYEPFISTKSKHLGMGLSLSRQHLEGLATISATNLPTGCRFKILFEDYLVSSDAA